MNYMRLYGALSPLQWVDLNLHYMLPSNELMIQMFFYVLHISMIPLKAHIHNIPFLFWVAILICELGQMIFLLYAMFQFSLWQVLDVPFSR
jgi:hypothetical protein